MISNNKKEMQEKINKLVAELDVFLLEKNMEGLDEYLKTFDIKQEPDLLVCVLRNTFMKSDELKEWRRLLSKVETELRSRNMNPEILLRGL